MNDNKPHIRAAIIWTTILAIVLAPLFVIGPFIAGYVGGRKAKTAPAAMLAALGPALIWTALWIWLSNVGLPIGKERVMPPADMFAPTTGLAILGGAFAGSGGRTAHIIGAAVTLCALLWFGKGAREFYNVYKTVLGDNPAPAPVDSASKDECGDRLKQLWNAARTYADSYDDTLPPADRWMTALQDPGQNLIADEKHLRCPEAGGGASYGFAMNRELGGKRFSEIKDQAQTPLFFDSSDLAENGNGPATDMPSPGRHGGRNNVVYVDGNVGQR